MWLTTERAQPGPVFGSKNYFTGMGLFFDTFANARHVSLREEEREREREKKEGGLEFSNPPTLDLSNHFSPLRPTPSHEFL